MSYNPPRTRNCFQPQSSKPYRLSRTRIALFLECPRCCYLDRRCGIDRPSLPAFSLNAAVDTLLKREFDLHRAQQTVHTLLEMYGIDAVPFAHEYIDDWRDALRKGVQYVHPRTNLLLTGGVDDVWINRQGALHVVDYKATCTTKEITLEDEWKQGYKRQMEFYQWLLRQNGFIVSDVGYFLFCNGDAGREAFEGRLEFFMTIVPYGGNDAWVEQTILEAYACLMSEELPECSSACEYCRYRRAINKFQYGA